MPDTLEWTGIPQNIIIYVILYGCETWSFTLKEECTLGAFENKVLGRIFGSKRDEATRGREIT